MTPPTRRHTDGPNFNDRREDRDGVLYAIRNGGFSGAIMPENILTGQDAEDVADFLSKYAGNARAERRGRREHRGPLARGMLDLRRIREDPDGVKAALARRGPGCADAIDDVLALDGERASRDHDGRGAALEQKVASEEVAAGQAQGRDVSVQLEH